MESHFGSLYGSDEAESDGEIEAYSRALFGSWPAAEALEDLFTLAPELRRQVTPDDRAVLGLPDPSYVIAILAGRMFLAGRESVQPGSTNGNQIEDEVEDILRQRYGEPS